MINIRYYEDKDIIHNKKHNNIYDKYNSNKLLITCGRQSGKTKLIANMINNILLNDKDQNILLVCPNRQMCDQYPRYFSNYHINKSLISTNNSSVKIDSISNNIKGYLFDHIFVDEIYNIKYDMIDALSPLDSWAKTSLFIGTPNGSSLDKLTKDFKEINIQGTINE